MKKKEAENKAKASIVQLLNIIERNRYCRDAYIELAAELVKIDKTDHAIRYFHMANELHEDYLSLYNLGSLYYKKSDYKKAIIILEKSKKLKSDFIMSSLVMGLCYSRLNNIKAAITNFINVLMIDPSNRTSLAALSILYHNNGKISDSRQLMKRLTDKYPSDEKVIKIKSDILYYSGESSKSLQEIKNLQKQSDKYRMYDEYIKSVPVEICNDRFGTLEDKIARLESDSGRDSESLIKLSLVHLFSGNTDSAVEYLFEARGKREPAATSSF